MIPFWSNDTGFDGSSRYPPQTKGKHFDNDFGDTAKRKVQKLDIPSSLKRKRVNDLEDFPNKVQKLDVPVSSKWKRDDNDLEEQQIKRISLF